MLAKCIKKLTGKHWLYLSLHVILILVGIILMLRWGEKPSAAYYLFPIGGSVVATGFAGIVLFLRVWLEQGESQRLANMRASGLNRIFMTRAGLIKHEYDERLTRASQRIDIMGYGLRNLREDYREDFETWARRAPVRILVLDPEFPAKGASIADLRDPEERNRAGTIQADVRELIKTCRPILQNEPARFMVRLYTCLPSITVFRIDQDVFWGPYFVHDVSRNMPTLLMETSGSVSQRVIGHFEKIWSSDTLSRPIPEEWFSTRQ